MIHLDVTINQSIVMTMYLDIKESNIKTTDIKWTEVCGKDVSLNNQLYIYVAPFIFMFTSCNLCVKLSALMYQCINGIGRNVQLCIVSKTVKHCTEVFFVVSDTSVGF